MTIGRDSSNDLMSDDVAAGRGPTIALTPTKSDREIAQDLRQRALFAVEPLLDLLREAAASGMALSFNFGFDQFGRPTTKVVVTKELAG